MSVSREEPKTVTFGENLTVSDLPLRDNLRGKSAYGAPQLLSLIHI